MTRYAFLLALIAALTLVGSIEHADAAPMPGPCEVTQTKDYIEPHCLHPVAGCTVNTGNPGDEYQRFWLRLCPLDGDGGLTIAPPAVEVGPFYLIDLQTGERILCTWDRWFGVRCER